MVDHSMPPDLNITQPFFLITILTGLVFVLMGIIQLISPPRKINSLYGYRTAASMKNQERWDFAQKYSAIAMVRLGALLCLLSVMGMFLTVSEVFGVVAGLSSLILIVAILLWSTEQAIKNKFGSD